MKKFKITNTATNETREFGVPDNATDQEYDAMKEIVIAGLQGNNEIGNIKIELIDAPDEIKERYIMNPDCDGQFVKIILQNYPLTKRKTKSKISLVIFN